MDHVALQRTETIRPPWGIGVSLGGRSPTFLTSNWGCIVRSGERGTQHAGRLLQGLLISLDVATWQNVSLPLSPLPVPSLPHKPPDIAPMSSASNTAHMSSDFEALFNAALAKYTKQTGKDIRHHPLVGRIDGCDSRNLSLMYS